MCIRDRGHTINNKFARQKRKEIRLHEIQAPTYDCNREPIMDVNRIRELLPSKNVVSVLSGGNMDVITMASLVQHGLINRGRIFTFSVLLPDRPGELMRVSGLLARNSGNIIKLEHNQFVNINRQNGVELKVTLEAFGQDHKRQILDELRQNGYSVQEVMTADFYH